ncbi:MAG: hypothetical protein ACLROU_13930, partial [Lachnospiraceae bacterium]
FGNKKCRIYAACGVLQTPKLAILERILTLSGRKSKFFTNYCLKIARNRMKKAIIEWYNAFKMYNIAINIIEIRQNVSLL